MTLRLHRCLSAPVLACVWPFAVLAAPPDLITQAIEIRSLSAEEAQKEYPAVLRGTVVLVEPNLVFIQDATSGTFFRPDTPMTLQLGDEVEVSGRTQPGLYVPGLGRAAVQLIRSGPLPPAVEVGFDDLASGRYFYQRVAVEGIVRSVVPLDEGRSLLRLALPSRRIEVRVGAVPEPDRVLVDSRVRIEGLASGIINDRRQLVQPYVQIQDWSDLSVVQSPPPPEQIQEISAGALLTYEVAGRGGHRVRLGGTVTAVFPNGMLYIRSDETAVAVRLASPKPLVIGDAVQVLGFPEMGRYSATLVDAELVAREAGAPPAPVRARVEDLFKGSYDCDLVTVTGLVSDTFRTERETIFVLQVEGKTIQARVYDGGWGVQLPTGSQVRVEGICRVQSSEGVGNAYQPQAIAIYVRSAADAVILRSPSWWTVRRLSFSLALLGGVILLAGLWIALLRRQVRRQAASVRSRIEAQAALEERQRIAREFHDTLEQELVGLSLRLDAVATRNLDDKGSRLVSASRSLVSRIQAETRNLISDLRDPSGDAGDLASALTEMRELHPAAGQTEVLVEIASALPPLQVSALHDLRMIARESVTNALKHSGATQIRVRLEVSDQGGLLMTISDNGSGFDAERQTQGRSGHFGCVGMSERCSKLGGTISWHSSAGEGTTVTLAVPLESAAAGLPGELSSR